MSIRPQSGLQPNALSRRDRDVVRAPRIELGRAVWKTAMLPLNIMLALVETAGIEPASDQTIDACLRV